MCHPGVQGGFRTSQERQKPLPQARGGYASPKPPLCASVGIKTSKGMARSGGMVTGGVGNGEWGSTHRRRGAGEPLAQPRPQGPQKHGGTAQSDPVSRRRWGPVRARGWDAAPGKHTRDPVGTRQVPGDAGISPRCYSPPRRASSGAFYSSPWLCRTAKPRKPRCAVPGTPITPGTGSPALAVPAALTRKILVKFPSSRGQTVPEPEGGWWGGQRPGGSSALPWLY